MQDPVFRKWNNENNEFISFGLIYFFKWTGSDLYRLLPDSFGTGGGNQSMISQVYQQYKFVLVMKMQYNVHLMKMIQLFLTETLTLLHTKLLKTTCHLQLIIV